MATVVKGVKASTKGSKSTAKAATAKAAPAKAAKTNGGEVSARKRFNPPEADVKAIAKRLRDGAKMNDIKAEHELTNGQPIRNALLKYGFDSKGNENPEGKTARQLAAERAAAKPAPAPKATKAASKTAEAAETPVKGSGKRSTKRAVKADPS